MKHYTETYYKVHYGIASCDYANCATLEDAEIRQAEIRSMQTEAGYKPEVTHIYIHTWARVLDDSDLVISESTTMALVK